jgi:hypothetical protein
VASLQTTYSRNLFYESRKGNKYFSIPKRLGCFLASPSLLHKTYWRRALSLRVYIPVLAAKCLPPSGQNLNNTVCEKLQVITLFISKVKLKFHLITGREDLLGRVEV